MPTSSCPCADEPRRLPGGPDGGVPDQIADLENELVDLWRRGRIQTRERSRLIHPRLDSTSYPLLVVLAQHEHPVPMSELVRVLELEKSTLTRQIDAVARLGLVERLPDPADARARLIGLTDEGRDRLAEVTTAAIGRWRERLSLWDPADVRELSRLLRLLAADQ